MNYFYSRLNSARENKINKNKKIPFNIINYEEIYNQLVEQGYDPFDENGKFLRKLCTAHREGCSRCINFCPFYKRGYEKVKKRYGRMKK